MKHSLSLRSLSSVTIFSVLAFAPLSSEAQTKFRLVERGGDREFFLATDELYLPGKGLVKIPPVSLGADIAGTADELLAQAAKLASEHSGARHLLVAYAGAVRDASTLRVFSNRVLVTLSGTNADMIKAAAAAAGAESYKEVAASPGVYAVSLPAGSGNIFRAMNTLRMRPEVAAVEPDTVPVHRGPLLIPDDVEFPQQWHLNSATSKHINVVTAWDDYLGNGSVIAIVDDGLDTLHPDLVPNLYGLYNYDWLDATPGDPSHGSPSDSHGTAVAGLAAARGQNGIGVSGVAPEAFFCAFRIIGGDATYSDFADMFVKFNQSIHIKNNSWGISGAPVSFLDYLSDIEANAIKSAAENGRNGAGTILVFAGGNRGPGSNVNFSEPQNSIYTIAVNATIKNGHGANFNSPGACLTVCAPGAPGLTTTDPRGADGDDLGDYQSGFQGTSASAPLVSGVIALMLEANPTLTYRDVQQILIETATKNDPGDPDWITNGAGYHFNPDYGAGLLNAKAAVDAAKNWGNLPSRDKISVSMPSPVFVPDKGKGIASIPFDFTGLSFTVERAELVIRTNHEWRGDLLITLKSPDSSGGTVCELTTVGYANEDFEDYSLTTTFHWGESASGVWTVALEDMFGAYDGEVATATLNLHGYAGSPIVGGGGGPGSIKHYGGVTNNGGVSLMGGTNLTGGVNLRGGINHSGGVSHQGGTGSIGGVVHYDSSGSVPVITTAAVPATSAAGNSATSVAQQHVSTPAPADSPAPGASSETAQPAQRPKHAIRASAAHINQTLAEGQSIKTNALWLKAAGSKPSRFSISDDAPWLQISPTKARVTDLELPLLVEFDAEGLSAGIHEAAIEIREGSREQDVQKITVALRVEPRALRVVAGEGPVWMTVTAGSARTVASFPVVAYGPGAAVFEMKADAPWIKLRHQSLSVTSRRGLLVDFEVHPADLKPALYSGSIACKFPDTGEIQNVPVELIVRAAGSSPATQSD